MTEIGKPDERSNTYLWLYLNHFLIHYTCKDHKNPSVVILLLNQLIRIRWCMWREKYSVHFIFPKNTIFIIVASKFLVIQPDKTQLEGIDKIIINMIPTLKIRIQGERIRCGACRIPICMRVGGIESGNRIQGLKKRSKMLNNHCIILLFNDFCNILSSNWLLWW